MRVLLDGRLLAEFPTGISRYTRHLVNFYGDHYGPENVSVLVNPYQSTPECVAIQTKLRAFRLIDFVRMRSLLEQLEFDLFHSPFYLCCHKKPDRGKIMTTVHDLTYRKVPRFFFDNLLNNLAVRVCNWMVECSLNTADKLLAVSETTRDDVRTAFGLDSVTIAEGLNEFTNDAEPVAELVEKTFFLYVGNDRPNKNLARLYQAFGMATTTRLLVVAGHNASCRVDPRVVHLGSVSDGQLRWLYEHCVALIYPSLYEGFGMPVLEALSYNATVLCSTGGALAEFPKEVVHSFNPCDEQHLKTLIESVDELTVDKRRVAETLAAYDWKHHDARLQEVIDAFT
jgi:glycosyltransferase involved in cell wall biosynthesis